MPYRSVHLQPLQSSPVMMSFLSTHTYCKSSQVILILRHQVQDVLQSLHQSVQQLRLLTSFCYTAYDRLRSSPDSSFHMQYNPGKIMVHHLHRQCHLHTWQQHQYRWYHACPSKMASFTFVPQPSVPDNRTGSSIFLICI